MDNVARRIKTLKVPNHSHKNTWKTRNMQENGDYVRKKDSH